MVVIIVVVFDIIIIVIISIIFTNQFARSFKNLLFIISHLGLLKVASLAVPSLKPADPFPAREKVKP